MRRIDFWIGKPLIWLLGLATRKARSLYGDAHPARPPERVICTKFIGLGSVVLSLPLLKALKESGVRVAFWSFPGQAELVRASGLAEEVWVIEPKLSRFLPSLLSTWIKARRFRAAAFIDLEPTANFTAILARLSRAPLRIGFMSSKPLREQLFTHLVAMTPERHIIENNLWMGRLLGISPHAETRLPEAPAMLDSVPNPLPVAEGRKRIIININSSDLSWHRMWPEDHWVKLCTELLADPAVELVFPGAPGERERVEQLLKRIPASDRIHSAAGKTSLTQLMRLLRDSSLVISVDSGIMHLAAWMGVPLVGLFGPETPRLYGPRSANARILWAALPCSPCLAVAADKITRCRDNQCMKRIGPDRALLACRALLSESAKRPERPTRPGFPEAA